MIRSTKKISNYDDTNIVQGKSGNTEEKSHPFSEVVPNVVEIHGVGYGDIV
jgi:hypothetical protein